jgi:transketolase
VAWKNALERKDGPSALIFSRQNLQHQERDAGQIAAISRGGYVLKDCAGEPELILIATGSEVGLAVQAFDKLTEQGRKVRVVSMPCTSAFDAQDAEYKQSVLPLQVSARIAIEAAHADFWFKYVGLEGRVIGMTTYGESAPASALFEEFGFTLENILGQAEELLED